MEVVSHAAEVSMRSAVEEVQSLPRYENQGDVRISSKKNIIKNSSFLIATMGY